MDEGVTRFSSRERVLICGANSPYSIRKSETRAKGKPSVTRFFPLAHVYNSSHSMGKSEMREGRVKSLRVSFSGPARVSIFYSMRVHDMRARRETTAF